MKKIHPSDCDGKCEECPISKQCSGIRLPQSKIDCICVVFLLFVAIAVIALIRSI